MINAVAMALAAAAAFNLNCSHSFRLQASHDVKPMEVQTRTTLRVDLAAMRWCSDDCRETRPVVFAGPRIITLVADADREIDAYESMTVNRESGRYDHHLRIGESSLDEHGTCKPVAFTGFPKPKF